MRKDHLVANARLARAAVEFGLDEYIVTKRFSSLQWHPEYVNELIDMEKHIDREISTKTLADVVESLIGASMLDGGLPKAISCMKLFLPELKWDSLENHRISLFELSPKLELGSFYNPLQKLLGYSFKKPSLLVEAITHASYISGLCSYERLEFLGDSILDYIVVQEIYPSGLSHMRMHELRTAFVNADLLAFLCMELHYNVEITDLEVVKGQVSSQDAIKSPVYEYKKTPVATKIPLYSFMRHDSEGILKAQAETKRRYEKMRDEISCALESGADYPWAALYGLRAEKFYSDIIEALLGAIWIDSGSLQVVASVVERMRIIKLLRRAITENLNTEHPKITLGKLADTSQVRYELSKDTDSTDGPELICKVLVDDEEVANVRGGVSRHDMETRAAIEAIDILKSKSEKQREKLKRPRDPEEKSGPSQSEKNEFMARDW